MWIYEPDVETMARPKRCKCGADIIFAKTKAGKQAPINARFKIISRQRMGEIELIELENGASHFATCSYAPQFRRRK